MGRFSATRAIWRSTALHCMIVMMKWIYKNCGRLKCAFLSSKTFLVSKQNHVTYFSRISAKHIAVRLRLLLSICLVLSKRKENTTHCLELLPSMDFQKEFCLCPPDFSTAGNKQNNSKNQNNPSPNNKIYFFHTMKHLLN